MSEIHIILADDDPDDCLIFSQVASEVNSTFKITCLHDCESLLEYLNTSSPPDIIFLDLNMPVLSGQDCLKKIKERAEWRNIPIVIYSTATRKDIIEECYKLGASLYIPKPNEANRLKETISSVVEKFVV